MAERAVFLDRDNTIIDNDGYLGDPSKVRLLPGAATALTAMRALGYRLIVVSNQSGVARGMFDEAAVEAVNKEMSRQLQENAGAYIDASYYCPYHPEAPLAQYRIDHDWRKPKCGMLRQAATDFSLDLSQSWMIGDQNRDVAAGVAAGCRTILLRDPGRPGGTPMEEAQSVSPSFVVRTLADAARIIAREGRYPPPVQTPAPAAPGAAPRPAPVPPAPASSVSTSESPAAVVSIADPAPSPREPHSPREPLAAVSPAPEPELPRREIAKAMMDAAPLVAGGPGMGLGGGSGISPKFERSLEELIVQLRQQNRAADLERETSRSDIAAMILQILALAALVLGIVDFIRAPIIYNKEWADIFRAEFAHQAAMIWLLVALVLQGMVIALIVRSRTK